MKTAWLARFRPDLDPNEAREYWTRVHGAIGARVPLLLGYVQNHVLAPIDGSGGPAGKPAYDGYACEWWPDEQTFRATVAGREWHDVVADDVNVFDTESIRGLAVVERLIKDGPRLPFKVVWFARFRPDLDREEASAHWRDVHGGIALGIPGIGRYLQNFAVRGLTVDGSSVPPAYDGFSECWFESREEFERATSSPQWDRLVEDGYEFLDMDSLTEMSAVLEERVIR